MSLNKIAEQFPLTSHITDFHAHLRRRYADRTTSKPSPDISDDEWQAFLRSSISADSENGKSQLYPYRPRRRRQTRPDHRQLRGRHRALQLHRVLKRGDDDLPPSTAATVIMVMISMLGSAWRLFSINGRGANQWNHWVKINGQVYALWYNGQLAKITSTCYARSAPPARRPR
ncbi:hypothetical protein LNP74_15405 [Klebsiella pneumoniae subsp. pneumoniae]|nr:hypothetical protein [Klebsiella pneumoniae subsp. pneumoniae]